MDYWQPVIQIRAPDAEGRTDKHLAQSFLDAAEESENFSLIQTVKAVHADFADTLRKYVEIWFWCRTSYER